MSRRVRTPLLDGGDFPYDSSPEDDEPGSGVDQEMVSGDYEDEEEWSLEVKPRKPQPFEREG